MLWKTPNNTESTNTKTLVFYSLSVQISKSTADEEDELLLVQNIIEFLKEETDVENIYRAIVAIGTLVRKQLTDRSSTH